MAKFCEIAACMRSAGVTDETIIAGIAEAVTKGMEKRPDKDFKATVINVMGEGTT